jgi:hypothetical protein
VFSRCQQACTPVRMLSHTCEARDWAQPLHTRQKHPVWCPYVGVSLHPVPCALVGSGGPTASCTSIILMSGMMVSWFPTPVHAFLPRPQVRC